MAIMAKRKHPETDTVPAAEPPDGKPATFKYSLLVRFDDPLIKVALKTYSKKKRQTQTAAIMTILETVLRASGDYPESESAKG